MAGLGFAADSEHARTAGAKGGAKVREAYGSDFFKAIGSKGGLKVAAERGKDYYSEIGRRGGLKRGVNAAAKRALLPTKEKRPVGRPKKVKEGEG